MCMDGVSHLVMNDEKIQALMSNPGLDLIHKQVVMNLYAMGATNRLKECRQMLPLYLGMDWSVCREILDVIEKAGLIRRDGDDIVLTHPVSADISHSCNCA